MVIEDKNEREEQNRKIKEIIHLASLLGWIDGKTECWTMNLADVEKCMSAMVDRHYLNLMHQWASDDELKGVQ